MTTPLPAELARLLNVQPGNELDHVHKTLRGVLEKELKRRAFEPSWTKVHVDEAQIVIDAGLLALCRHPFDRSKGCRVTTWAVNYARGRMVECLNEMCALLDKEIVDASGIAHSEDADEEVFTGGGNARRIDTVTDFDPRRSCKPRTPARYGDKAYKERAGTDLGGNDTTEYDTFVLHEGDRIEGIEEGRTTAIDDIVTPYPFASGFPDDPRELEVAPRTAPRAAPSSTLEQWAAEIADLCQRKKGGSSSPVARREQPVSLARKFGDTQKKWLTPLDPGGKPTARETAEEAKQARYETLKAAERAGRTELPITHADHLRHFSPRPWQAFWLWVLYKHSRGQPPTEKQWETKKKLLYSKMRAGGWSWFKPSLFWQYGRDPTKKPPPPSPARPRVSRFFILRSLLDFVGDTKKAKPKADQ